VPETTPVFYFPGLSRDYAETEALEGELFPHVRFDGLHGDDGLGHSGYQATRVAAQRKLYALALAHRPPKAMQFLPARDLEEEEHPPEVGMEIAPPIIDEGPMDFRLSLDTCNAIQAEPGHCWSNARQAFFDMPNAFLMANYVEGWVVGQWSDAIRLIEHGWIWTPGTGIVDPTIVLKPVPLRLLYLPGVQLSWLQLQQYATARLPLARSMGLHALEYQHACQQALNKAEELAWQTGLPMVVQPGGVRMIRVVGETLQVADMAWEFPVPSPSIKPHSSEQP
jgi:hypothetical protein